MKIDFHCHTLAAKRGDGDQRNVSPEQFAEKVLLSQVKIVCITNHNTFNTENYYQLKMAISDKNILLLPGIELDVEGIDEEHYHATIIFDNEKIEEISKTIKNRIGEGSPDTICITTDSYIDLCNSEKCITAVHYGKSPAPKDATISFIKEKINNKVLFFYEPSDYRFLDILVNHNYKTIIGSDVKDWNEYEKSTFTETKIDVEGFDGLYGLFSRKESIIETFLNTLEEYKINISANKGESIIKLFQGVNILFGSKASGKSFTLDKIESFFRSKGKTITYYKPKDTNKDIDKILKVESKEKGLSKYGVDDCEKDFSEIKTYNNALPLRMADYKKFISTRNLNRNKDRIKIVSLPTSSRVASREIERIKNNIEQIKIIEEAIGKIDNRYIDNYAQLCSLIDLIKDRIIDDYAQTIEKQIEEKLIKHLKETITNAADNKTATKSKPIETGFKSFAEKVFLVACSIVNICNSMDIDIRKDKAFVSALSDKKNLYKQLQIKMVGHNSTKLDGFKNITVLKQAHEFLLRLEGCLGNDSLEEEIELFNKELSSDIQSLEDMVSYRRIFLVNEKEYILSSGEETMISLGLKCNESSDVYLFDEPEKSLGNSYVNDVLIESIKRLSSLNKTIIIATHNANVAIRTLPIMSILKEYDGHNYKTYIGNSYTDKLVNIMEPESVKSWKEESINILEGGRMAFSERSEVYGKYYYQDSIKKRR